MYMSNEFYPMHILESRYNGTYSGGAFILIAGVKNPRENTEAVGSDNECIEFWSTIENEGPEIEIDIKEEDGETETKTIYADSGPHPAVLFDRFKSYSNKKTQKRAANIITEVILDHPDLKEKARDDIVSLHKILALTQSIYTERYLKQDILTIKKELSKRFLEYDSMPSIQTLSDEQVKNVTSFVESEGKSPPLIYEEY